MSEPRVDGTLSETLIVADRLPMTWDSRLGWRRSTGGPVTALEAVLRRSTTAWMGPLNEPPTSRPPRWEPGPLLPVVVDDRYQSATRFCDEVLQPAAHGDSDRIRWTDDGWHGYLEFNWSMATAIRRQLRRGRHRQVWLHGWHLALVPALLRSAGEDAAIGLSIHTPFDGGGLARLPRAEELRNGIAGTDVLGLQTSRDVEDWLGFVEGAVPSDRRPDAFVSAVSVDVEHLDRLAADEIATARAARRDARRDGDADRLSIVGVDRLDHTKGIVERLEAVDLVFRRGILQPDQVQITQIVQPSTSDDATHPHLREEVERCARRLASTWRRRDGTSAVAVLVASVDRRDIIELLATADVALVTPRRDGMNLVAKEFSVVNHRHGGALVLGRGAGAVEELGHGSYRVDGGDPVSVADGLATALRAPSEDLRLRANWRRRQVERHQAADWGEQFLARLDRGREAGGRSEVGGALHGRLVEHPGITTPSTPGATSTFRSAPQG